MADCLPRWWTSTRPSRVDFLPEVGIPSSSRTMRWCDRRPPDRKSTRLNSSHSQISYAVFCLEKKSQYSPSPALRLWIRYPVSSQLRVLECAHRRAIASFSFTQQVLEAQ